MDTLKDKQWLENLHESGQAPWQLWEPDRAAAPELALRRLRMMLPLTLGAPSESAGARARARRPPRRHRDRLRRHAPEADRAGARSPRSAGSCSAASGERADEARASAEALLEGVPRSRGDRRATSATASSPTRAQRIKDFFEELKARRRAGPGPHPPARRPAPGPSPHLRAHLEHVPRPPDPRVRGPEVRRRHGRARTPSSRSPSELSRRKIDHLMEHFGTQRSKRWFSEDLFSSLLRLRGMECNSPTRLRRGVLLPQSRTRVSTVCDRHRAHRRRRRRLRAHGAAVPALPQPHRRRRARDVRPDRASRSRSRRPRSPAARGSSTGSSPTSGTSATPTSRPPTARASSTSADSTLHVVSYSEPVRTTLPLEQLRERLHTLPDQPDLIPYRTSYYDAHLGLLPPAQPAARARAGRLRGGHRLDARARPPHLRRARDRGRRRGRGPGLDLRLPPLARQRQPVRDRRRDDARARAARARRCATPTASSSPRGRSARSPGCTATATGLDRIEHGLARLVHRRRRRPHLQAQPPRRRRRRPGDGDRPARHRARRTASSRGSPGAATSASSARPASTSRWAR